MRTARSFSSDGYRFDVAFFSMTPSSFPRYRASGDPRPIQQDVPKEFPFLSVRYLQRLVQERRIPSWKIGRRVYLDRADLLAIPIERPAISAPIIRKLMGVS